MLPLRKIVCPTDFSVPSLDGVATANELALHFGAEVLLVHVVPPVPVVAATPGGASFNIVAYQEEMVSSSKERLAGMQKERFAQELHVRPIVSLGSAANEIIRIAGEENVDLIVMATHGETGWRRLVFGSVAERVVRLSDIPVLTIRAPREEDGGGM